MDDGAVVRAFVSAGATDGFGPTLNIERDALLLDGWWHAAFRVTPETFIVRNDDPPSKTRVLDDLAAELSARGLQAAADDLPAAVALTYAELSLGTGVGWTLWAPDRASGEAALAARIGAESYLEDAGEAEALSWENRPSDAVPDLSASLEGARRMVGVPVTVVVAVGLGTATLDQLRLAVPECRFESVSLDVALDACGPLHPALVIVDATTQEGREFIMEFRADACGRFLPVVALTHDELPLGADLALAPDQDPNGWAEPIRQLLPG